MGPWEAHVLPGRSGEASEQLRPGILGTAGQRAAAEHALHRGSLAPGAAGVRLRILSHAPARLARLPRVTPTPIHINELIHKDFTWDMRAVKTCIQCWKLQARRR